MEKQSYQGLSVWQKGIKLTNRTYTLTKKFPPDERFGLCSQMQRAVVSIPSNIAEGYRRHSKPEMKRFLYIALGSLSELETQFVIARNQNYIVEKEYEVVREECEILSRMLYAFIKKLR